MRTNLRSVTPSATTHEGARSPTLSATAELRRSVMACMLFEDSFYESGQDAATRIRELVSKVPFEDGAQIAIDAREKFKLRHVPLLVTRELIRHHHGRKVGDLIYNVIQRPDEIGELLALYRKDGKSVPSQMKIGIARAFKKFNEYQLAKNDNPKASFRLRDALFLSHANPAHGVKGASRYTKVERKLRNHAKVYKLTDNEQLYARIAADELTTPDTWEVALSGGADKREVFTRLINDNKLGALALLRNLRNMIESGVDEDVIRKGLAIMKTDRVLPFRFITAARYAPRLEDALEQAMFRSMKDLDPLPGKTALLIDHSHSMDAKVSAKSEVTRFEAAAALAMILREHSAQTRVFTFSTSCIEIPPRRGFAMVDAIRKVRIPEATMLGKAVRYIYSVFPECERIIVITDEQSQDRPPHPQGTGYVINVAGYKQGIAYGPWVAIDGWSEAVLNYVKEYEAS